MNVSQLETHPIRSVRTRWRRIESSTPASGSNPIIERLRAVEPRSLHNLPPILWHETDGFLIRDTFGNQWIDLTSGIVATNSGHSHPRVREALINAATYGPLFTYAFPHEARCLLLEKLIALVPMSDAKAILFSSGTEATECAMALMRRAGQSVSRSKVGIISFEKNYHGRTLGAALASGWSDDIGVPAETAAVYTLPFRFEGEKVDGRTFANDIAMLEAKGVDTNHIAGIICEPMPGWTTRPMAHQYAEAMAAWAHRHNILITFDEIQSGCGRTGSFFAFEHVGIVPDLITLGKGLSSSLPVSAVVGRRAILDIPKPGDMSSTHGGNPVCAAAALANLKVIEEEGLIERAKRTGELILPMLRMLKEKYPDHVRGVYGKGLFISIHFKLSHNDEPDVRLADAIAEDAVRNGLMMFSTGRGYLKITPPLCIDEAAAVEAVEVLIDCFRRVKNVLSDQG